MSEVVAVALGGALGAVTRFWGAHLVTRLLGSEFPWGILIVNISGSILIGIAFVLLVEKALMDSTIRSFVTVGVLGAFTTFSTFSMQAFSLLENGRFVSAVVYILGSVLICIAGTALGVLLTRMLS